VAREAQGGRGAHVDTALDEDRAIITIYGGLDLAITSQLEAELAVVAARQIPLAILDLQETTSVEEVAIPRLTELQDDSRRAGVEWALVRARPAGQVCLELGGLTDLATVLGTVQDGEGDA
jgi:anti-anti-sigma regulatory factor